MILWDCRIQTLNYLEIDIDNIKSERLVFLPPTPFRHPSTRA